jgi:hypothetical protein
MTAAEVKNTSTNWLSLVLKNFENTKTLQKIQNHWSLWSWFLFGFFMVASKK